MKVINSSYSFLLFSYHSFLPSSSLPSLSPILLIQHLRQTNLRKRDVLKNLPTAYSKDQGKPVDR